MHFQDFFDFLSHWQNRRIELQSVSSHLLIGSIDAYFISDAQFLEQCSMWQSRGLNLQIHPPSPHFTPVDFPYRPDRINLQVNRYGKLQTVFWG